MSEANSDIELKLAYQERTIDELNAVVTEQAKRIDELEAKLRRFMDRVEAEAAVRDASEEEPPPHY